jgi:hypothetical protein
MCPKGRASVMGRGRGRGRAKGRGRGRGRGSFLPAAPCDGNDELGIRG